MFLSNRGSFRPETSGAYTLRRRGRRRPKSGSAIGACAVARLAGSGGPIGDYYGSANTILVEFAEPYYRMNELQVEGAMEFLDEAFPVPPQPCEGQEPLFGDDVEVIPV